MGAEKPESFFINLEGVVLFEMNDERQRLRKLIEHWAEHNEDHRVRFEDSAREASRMGLEAWPRTSMLPLRRRRRYQDTSGARLRGSIEGFSTAGHRFPGG
jgi:hypothetical protein